MRIIAARIRNFKLLRNVDLAFSIDRNRPLTVIRAENGSGKTSALQALRWALYGKSVLDDPQVRLSPAYWADNTDCPISIEIDFIDTKTSQVAGDILVSEVEFMLKREVIERPNGDRPNREQERVSLYEKTPSGSVPSDNASSIINQILPQEMIDIFFTDGDAAMTFISPQLSDNTKRDNVKDAIRSLLGLDLFEQVDKRLVASNSEVNRKVSKNASSENLTKVTEEIEKNTAEKETLDKSINDLKQQIVSSEQKLTRTRSELTRMLEAGSYEQLAHQREGLKKQIDAGNEEEYQLKKEHQRLFEHESLSWDMLDTLMTKGYDSLKGMHAKGDIPRAAVPILKERLELQKCICGAALVAGSEEHAHVTKLIEIQREGDSHVEYLSSLFYQARNEVEKREAPGTKQWSEESESLQEKRLILARRNTAAYDEQKSVEAKINRIEDEEIETKRGYEKTLTSSLQNKTIDLDRKNIQRDEKESRLKELEREQKELSLADQRMAGLNAEKAALDDLQKVVQGTLAEMQSTYLSNVSGRMNELFLSMIGADPEQNGVFQGAEITEEYSIIVRTLDGRTLNPDYEVNGASQRALTFAFIWALTEVSGVVAPRVIDTPLGMMSGEVKRRVLKLISKAAGEDVDRQVVLFLTQSEIANTEDILDEQTGKFVTLIKTDDFPADLVNDPNADESEVRLCNCTHREYCDQCQRTNHDDFDLKYRN